MWITQNAQNQNKQFPDSQSKEKFIRILEISFFFSTYV